MCVTRLFSIYSTVYWAFASICLGWCRGVPFVVYQRCRIYYVWLGRNNKFILIAIEDCIVLWWCVIMMQVRCDNLLWIEMLRQIWIWNVKWNIVFILGDTYMFPGNNTVAWTECIQNIMFTRECTRCTQNCSIEMASNPREISGRLTSQIELNFAFDASFSSLVRWKFHWNVHFIRCATYSVRNRRPKSKIVPRNGHVACAVRVSTKRNIWICTSRAATKLTSIRPKMQSV